MSQSQHPQQSPASTLHQTLIGLGALAVAAGMAYGAISISSAAGYSGVGPNFLPWVGTLVLAVCGAWLLWEARTGGFREMEEPSGHTHADWVAFAWLSAGVLANAALITTIGFVLSCTLCFVLAVRGLRVSEQRPGGGVRRTVIDGVTGILIAAPVYWMFTKLLAINLPGLTGSGWI
jgi:putative tricarboxylic transport membrane protein